MALSLKYRRILNRMEYYEYQRGLIYHHLSEHGGWNSHLKRCREFILKAVDYYKPSIVTVLGSGWLLDFPLSEIAGSVSRINLVDIVHPPEVKDQIAGMKNVVLREEDISGGLILEVWNKARRRIFFNKLRSFDAIQIHDYKPDFDPGLIVSLNILTQLESMPVAFLRKRSSLNEEKFTELRKNIQAGHIRFLCKHKSVLITDLAEIITEDSGKVREIPSLLTELPEGKLREEWTWNFDLEKSDYFTQRSIFKVAAIIL